jgi:hypothetical protein
LAIPAGRFKRSLFGYRRGEVDAAIIELEADAGRRAERARACEAQVAKLREQLTTVRAESGQREREIGTLREELDSARSQSREEIHSLAVLGAHVAEIRVLARGQATRMRLRALREASELCAAVGAAGNSQGEQHLLEAVDAAIDRIGAEWDGEPLAGPEQEAAEAEAPQPAAGAAVEASVNGDRAQRVSVDIGPFRDFSQLVSFEDAANAIGATEEISIRRFSEGRAQIEVELSEPVDLLRELEERCDLEFVVRARNDDGLILDVGE